MTSGDPFSRRGAGYEAPAERHLEAGRARALTGTARFVVACAIVWLATLARLSHHLTVEARNRLAITALRLLAVLNGLFEYASARRASRALY